MNGQTIAKLRDKFLNSPDGVRCTSGTADGQYLRNRIELAYIAGINAAEDLLDEAADNLEWMIAHFDAINAMDNPGKEDSPELTKAKELLKRLRGA